MPMPEKKFTSIAVAIIALLLALSFWKLNIDPPLFYVGHSQAQITDPYHLTFSARNAVQTGEWNPKGYHRWDVFKYSIVSGVSYLLFSLFGVSRITANMSALLLHLGGFLLFLFALSRFRPREEWLIAALLLLFNSTLFFFGRLPFLENGLILFSGLTFWILVRYHEKIWGQFICGFVIALAALAGKLFGLILIGPVIVTLYYIYRKQSIQPIAITLAGLIFGFVAQIVLFYDGDMSIPLSYYTEQTVGMYGGPPGFSSVINFFKMLITYGGESSLWRFTPFLFGLGLLSLLITSLTFPLEKKHRPELVPILFLFLWFIGGVAGLMPFQYRPIRYSLFLLLPLSGLCAYLITMAFRQKIRIRLASKAILLPLIFLFVWFGLTQLWVLGGSGTHLFDRGVSAMPLTGMIAFVVTAFAYLWIGKRSKPLPESGLRVVIGLLIVGFVVTQSSYLYRGLERTGNYLEDANKELAMVVGDDATLTGPYMPALTIDNNLSGVIYMFGMSNIQRDLFTRFNVTHVLADNTNWKSAVKDFPFLKSATMIVQLITRDRAINLYRLPDAKSKPTNIEKAALFLVANQLDSALYYCRVFHKEQPTSLFGDMSLVVSLLVNQKADEAVSLMESMAEHYPDNYMIHFFCKVNYQRLYAQTRDPLYRERSSIHEKRAAELNPVLPASGK